MSITEELRMYVQDWRDTPSLMDGLDRGDVDGILEDFIRIADRIDAEHRAALEKVAAMVDGCERSASCDLELRVARLERKLNHRGGNA